MGTASQERPAQRVAAALASQALLLSFQLLISAPHYISAVSPLVWSNQVRVGFFFSSGNLE